MRSKILSLLILMVTLLPSLVRAQENVMNTFSAYSMYGLGLLETQGTLATRSMGGAGVGSRSMMEINVLNPASYSIALQKGILMNLGVEGSQYNSTQTLDGVQYKSENTTANIQDIALQIPIMKGLGFGLSVTPYSNVGYQIENAFMTDAANYMSYIYEGSGTISLVKFGVGWQISPALSVGIAGQYYWGELDREFTASITNIVTSGDAISMAGVDNISVSKMKGQLGVQYAPYIRDSKSLTFGATFDLGGDLEPRYARVVMGDGVSGDIYAQNDTTQISIVLPRQVSVGATYVSQKFIVALDYTYQNWVNNNEDVEYSYSDVDVVYNNVNQLRLGVEYIPRRMDVRRYLNRVAYRAGLRYGGYQYTFAGEKIGQYAATCGLGFPINKIGISRFDIGFEWGRLGDDRVVVVDNSSIGLVKQDYFKVALGMTLFGDDYWFQRPQID